jgi:acetolactate synthase-1/2/3 large subunit
MPQNLLSSATFGNHSDELTPESCIRDLASDETAESVGKSLRIPKLQAINIPEEYAATLEINKEPKVRAADDIINALVALGVDTFFGVPGGPVSPIFDAILNCPRARLIESRHETGAAFAAAGYYRANGSIPCVVITAGPGATNAVTGIVSAHFEQIPMLIISGDVAWSAEGGRLLQDSGPEGIDIEGMLRNVTRATIRVAQAQSAAAHAVAALRAATNPEHRGPALLVVPIHRASASANCPRLVTSERKVGISPDPDVVRQVCEKLVNARRPLIVIGAGARPYAETLLRLANAFDVPFVTTPRAKGLVSELHPRSLRHGGLAASMWARNYTAQGVDVALVLGTDLDDCTVGPTRYIADDGYLIHVDVDARVFNRNLSTSLGIVADVGAFVSEMLQYIRASGSLHGRIGEEVRAIRQTSAFDVPDFASDNREIIPPYRALADLERAAGKDSRFVADIGEHMLFALHYLTAKGPEHFMINLGLGSMGSGICSAIGLSLGDKTRKVICICGDGSMQMAGMEVLVALKERLKIVFAVFNDARYNMVYHGYRQVFGREAPWESPWIDFAGWARALGIPSARINHPGEISENLLDVLTSDGPAVLDIRIDRHLRVSGGGRNESLQHMSMLAQSSDR